MANHTSQAVTRDLIKQTAARVGATAVVLNRHKSRSHFHAFEVKLEGTSRRRPNSGSSGAGTGYAATWDQWGVVLAAIFAADPDAKEWADKSASDFHLRTNGRFDRTDALPYDAHGDHRFKPWGNHMFGCDKCSAVMDYRHLYEKVSAS